MKVKFKNDFYEWRAGVVYDAEPTFMDNLQPKERVKVFLPNSVICVLVPWDMVEVVA